MDETAFDLHRTYNTGEPVNMYGWKENETFTPQNALEVWKAVKSQFPQLSQNNNLLFVSPTAAYPTHEAELFRHEANTRKGRVTFLVGDLMPTNPQRALYELAGLQADGKRFAYFNWDARNLPIRQNSADVIWDRLGWLRHTALLPEKNRATTLKTLESYHSLLKPGGLLVFDADSNDTGVPSAEQLISGKYGETFWGDLVKAGLFALTHVGEGTGRVAVLQKEPQTSL